jgi:hypothetical protein
MKVDASSICLETPQNPWRALLYYCIFVSSRAAAILWGRLATCGRLAIGQMPLTSSTPRLRLAAMRGRLSTTASRRVANPPQDGILPHLRLPAAIFAALALASAGCNREHKVTVRETVEETRGATALPVMVNMGDAKQESQLVSGFYGIEANSWRWTAKDFTVSLRPPTGAATQGATLVFALSIPGVVIDKLKSVTLSASINGTPLAPETYAHDGQYDYKREVPSNLLTGNAVRVEFHLDKAMPPAGGDSRELGVVARSVGLESK